MTGRLTRRRIVAIAGALAWMLLLSPASAQSADEQSPPDQVDPPAEGEGEPLDDPTDPPPPEYSTAAQPTASVSLSGARWARPSVQRYRAAQRYAGARRASRVGWPRGARSVVLASGESSSTALAATTLAGAVEGPLLLTKPRDLSPAAAGEIKRLQPKRVFIVGRLPQRIARQVGNLGPNVVRVVGKNRYETAMTAARVAANWGANTGTVIVVPGRRWSSSLGVSALAAGRQYPVLLARRASGGPTLTRRVRALEARRVLVVAPRRLISDSVVRNLPRVRRIAGSSPAETAARTARFARRSRLTGRPMLVGAGHWSDAVAWGAMAGGQRQGVVLASRGPGLSAPVGRWLSDFEPARVGIVRGARRLPPTAVCQVASGRFRSWYCAEKTLKRQGYHIPNADGRVDRFSIWAIYAFEKVARRSANGSFGNAEWARMLRNPRHAVRRKDLPDTHVEIDIGRQLILLVENGKVRHQIHTSTGAPATPTIRGTFTVYEMRPYYQTDNKMYWPVFFHGGYALHGYPSIPTYPASHGCARTYNGNMDLIYRKMFYGERVATY